MMDIVIKRKPRLGDKLKLNNKFYIVESIKDHCVAVSNPDTNTGKIEFASPDCALAWDKEEDCFKMSYEVYG